MMKLKLFILLLLSLVSCFGQPSNKIENSCKVDLSRKLDLDRLEYLILGDWEYEYSFVKDTCFYIADLKTLPINCSFGKANMQTLASQYPRLFAFGEDKLWFGLVCHHSAMYFGDTSYPLINTIAKDSSSVRVTHYTKENGVGKGYSYFLEAMDEDKLVLRNERNYDLGNQKVKKVRHVFKKTAP